MWVGVVKIPHDMVDGGQLFTGVAIHRDDSILTEVVLREKDVYSGFSTGGLSWYHCTVRTSFVSRSQLQSPEQ